MNGCEELRQGASRVTRPWRLFPRGERSSGKAGKQQRLRRGQRAPRTEAVLRVEDRVDEFERRRLIGRLHGVDSLSGRGWVTDMREKSL